MLHRMATASISLGNLRELRERLLRYSFGFVVRHAAIADERLRKLEAGEEELSVWEAHALSRLYGIDDEALTETPIQIPGDAVPTTLGCVDEFLDIGESVRRLIVNVAMAARDLVRLRELLSVPQPVVPQLTPSHAQAPWETGKDAARRARKMLGPPQGPIASMRDWVRDALPGVAVLYARLGEHGPAGLTFAGETFGPAIALNLDGKNTNASVRRFSLAHEVYHLLVDWNRTEPLAVLSGWMGESQLQREQRANSFAVRFLCPEAELHKHVDRAGTALESAAEELMKTMGLHYSAVRLYLQNERSITLPATMPSNVRVTGAESVWERAEEPDGLTGFPLPEVPTERRTLIARYASEAYSRGLIRRRAFAEFLAVPPTARVDRVVTFFDLDMPDEG